MGKKLPPAIVLDLKELKEEINFGIRCKKFVQDFERTYSSQFSAKAIWDKSVNLTVSFNKEFKIWYHPYVFCWGLGHKPLIKNCQAFLPLWQTDYLIWKLSTEDGSKRAWNPASANEFMKRFSFMRTKNVYNKNNSSW